MKVVVSAPGKIHLMGEHAVVWGKPAILTAIDKRLTATIEQSTSDLEIISNDEISFIRDAIKIVCQEYQIEKLPALKIVVSSSIPSGYHLGSSAACAVATVGALIYFVKKIWNPEIINKLAFIVEKKQHGNPSGGDNTIVTYGGLIWYRRELEFLKSMWQLPFKIDKNLNHFLLINSGKPRESTGEMVDYVKLKFKNEKLRMMRLFDENEEQVRSLTVALKEGDEKQLISAMKIGERTLEGMGVVSDYIKPIIRKIEGIGGAAKILGGGGKRKGVGYLLCYHKDINLVRKIASKFKFIVESVQPGEEGVRLESGKYP